MRTTLARPRTRRNRLFAAAGTIKDVSAGADTPDAPDTQATPTAVRWVRAAQRGDALAMSRLLDELTPYVGRLCAPIALADGPDAAQEALIAIFQNLRSLREPEALYGWTRRIAVREAIRVAQRTTRQQHAELAELPAPGSPELAVDIRDVLNRLSPEHRAILMLREVEGLDERSAAEVLDVSAGTAKSRLSRAKAAFRKQWTS
ncbi:RNA polymerase, sigma-24 subunit, ECF subfamily [Catenulispora acidiphila DSM 44928]|uniref:RNA polymerase, sigma-24 subunit, ECF subfamily n=1 Tax=Catenulispora acidiphila (strain DSM 44928 / JCM 14897 / NBRC 102108 / NRRL B-24433 / ID139908) TaxID=479433 RepID=C7QIB7_CATAD|nr:RNA polymerase, sigma-24 subunit, ECF subfamily [Catenulispora acidiphila DSM 44928]